MTSDEHEDRSAELKPLVDPIGEDPERIGAAPINEAHQRRVGRNKGCLSLSRTLEGAREPGCFIKLNAHPTRRDLDDVYCKLAKEMGLLASIGTTAHSTVVFGVMCCDIGRGRRAWLGAKYVRNARIWAQLKPLLAR